MLLYHPAFDIHHCIFRILRLLLRLPQKNYEIEKVRILDFYLLFPSLISNIKFPLEARRQKSKFTKLENKYNEIKDPYRIFIRLEPFQMGALKCLVSYGVLDVVVFRDAKIKFIREKVPQTLIVALEKANLESAELISLLTDTFSNIDLYGDSGLKARTDLFEHRYDYV